jgi:hypothetical protein
MLPNKNVRLPGASAWTRFVNGGVSSPTLLLMAVGFAVVVVLGSGRPVILSAPMLLMCRLVETALILYTAGGWLVIAPYEVRRVVRQWSGQPGSHRRLTHRRLSYIYLVVSTALSLFFAFMMLALLWPAFLLDTFVWSGLIIGLVLLGAHALCWQLFSIMRLPRPRV